MTASLLQHGADPNAHSDTGDALLHLAVRSRMLGLAYEAVWKTGNYAIGSLRNLIADHETEEASDIYQATDQAIDQAIDQARIYTFDTLLGSENIDANIANAFGDCPQHVIDFRKDYAL